MLSSLNGCCLYSHLCSVEITAHCLYDTVLFVQSEYQHRHLILKAHDRCGQIYCHKLLIDDFLNRNLIILLRFRIHFRIAVIDSVNCFARSIASASISIARRTAPVSVENTDVLCHLRKRLLFLRSVLPLLHLLKTGK